MKRSISTAIILGLSILISCSPAPREGGTEGIPYVDTGVDPEAWALVPAGEFFYGQHSHETMVDYDYEIMITDVTNSQYAKYLAEALEAGSIKLVDNTITGYYPGDEFHNFKHEIEITAGDKLHMTLGEPGGRIRHNGSRFTVEMGFSNHPVVMVTWFGAKAYADFYGYRLPAEIEWEKAARGTDERAYPWGDELARDQANYYSNRDLTEKLVGEFVPTTPVGYYNGRTHDGRKTTEGKSPYGLYDMAGNVWQWTGNVYHYQHLRYMRGGSSSNYEYNLTVWMRNSASPDHYGINIGFRCVRDPQD